MKNKTNKTFRVFRSTFQTVCETILLGTVEAKNAESARIAAMEKFNIKDTSAIQAASKRTDFITLMPVN